MEQDATAGSTGLQLLTASRKSHPMPHQSKHSVVAATTPQLHDPTHELPDPQSLCLSLRGPTAQHDPLAAGLRPMGHSTAPICWPCCAATTTEPATQCHRLWHCPDPLTSGCDLWAAATRPQKQTNKQTLKHTHFNASSKPLGDFPSQRQFIINPLDSCSHSRIPRSRLDCFLAIPGHHHSL